MKIHVSDILIYDNSSDLLVDSPIYWQNFVRHHKFGQDNLLTEDKLSQFHTKIIDVGMFDVDLYFETEEDFVAFKLRWI